MVHCLILSGSVGKGRASASRLIKPLFSMEIIFTVLKIHEYHSFYPAHSLKAFGSLTQKLAQSKKIFDLK